MVSVVKPPLGILSAFLSCLRRGKEFCDGTASETDQLFQDNWLLNRLAECCKGEWLQ